MNASNFRTIMLGFASTLALTAPTMAQDAPDDAVEEIIIRGFKGSLYSAIEAKRNADTFIEAISAEDIGRLPDVSIAESLARLPGVTSQRTGGQASAINIRGLSQDLVSSTLNGREQIATSGNRVIEFDQYPSELISAAQVYKSPKASLIEGGVAGKVELKTARPLDISETIINLNFRGTFNDRADQSPDVKAGGYRASGSVQFKNEAETLGVALGYARLSQPNVATRFVGFDYTLTAGANVNIGQQQGAGQALDLNGNGVQDRISFGFEGIQFGGREVRDGALAVVQFEPVPEFRVLIDGYYSHFESDVRRRGIRLFGTNNVDSTTLQDAVLAGDAIVGGTFISGNGVGVELVNQDESDTDELYSVGGKVEYDFSNVTAALDLSYSRGESFFNNSGINVRPFSDDGNGGQVRTDSLPGAIVAQFQLNGTSLPSNIAFNTDFTNPNNFLFDGLFIVPQEDTDEIYAVANDYRVHLDNEFLSSIELGFRYAERDAERIVTSFRTFGPDGGALALDPAWLSVAGFSGDYGATGLPNFLVVDIDAALDAAVGEERIPDQAFGFTQDQSFTISEDVISGYVQSNIDSEVAGFRVTGNVGVRVVHTDQGSTSSLTNPVTGERENVTRGDKYTDVLPSLNVSFHATDNDQIRFSASRQISRARFFELRNSISVNVDGSGFPSGGGGNPELRPFRANQFDLSYEHYFGSDGLLSVAGFYKQLKSFIIGGTIEPFNFVEQGITLPPVPGGAPAQPVGRVSAPVNGEGGRVYGVELNFIKSFSELPAPFDGLGVVLNYAYSKSNLDITNGLSGEDFTIPLPGLSKHVANPTVFYEKGGFSTRIGMRYRSGFVAPQIGINEQITGNASELVTDFQMSYDFDEDTSLGGLTLLFQANNITDEPTRSFFGPRAQTGTIQKFGRQFFFGASYSF